MADATVQEIDRLVGAATPHFAYQLRARILELIQSLPPDHPTRRYGVENSVSLRVSETVRVRGGLTYTRAVFRGGPFAGNDVPLVSKWSGSAGLS